MTKGSVLAMAVLVVLAACGRGGPQGAAPAAAARPAAAAKKGQSAQEQTVGMVEAASSGKSAVPVQVKFDLLARPALGQTLDVDIAVLPQIDASAATIQLTSRDGLDLPSGVDEFAFLTVEADQVYRHKISLKPTAVGVLVLGLTVTLTHDEVVESRNFSIPIIVLGGPSMAVNLQP